MKFGTTQVIPVVLLIAGAASAASAAEPNGPWSLSITGGDSVGLTGSMRTPTSTSIGDLGTVDPALAGTSGTLSLDKLGYEDLFKRRFDAGVELAYSFDDNLEAYGRFDYESLGGRARNIGELSTDAAASPEALRARFSDADNQTYELGARYYWSAHRNLRPFAGVAVGATHLDSMRASIASADGSLDLTNVRFTRPGTVFSQSAEAGVEYNPNSTFGMRFSVNANHAGTPESANDPQLNALGLNAGNDAQDRWSFPVSIAASYRF